MFVYLWFSFGLFVTNTCLIIIILDLLCFFIIPLITFEPIGSTNSGPYHRIIDPTIDLLETYRAHAKLSSLSKFWFAFIDKAPPGYEFVLRGLGSIHNPSNTTSTTNIGKVGNILNEITFVDRSTCLQADPIRCVIHRRIWISTKVYCSIILHWVWLLLIVLLFLLWFLNCFS